MSKHNKKPFLPQWLKRIGFMLIKLSIAIGCSYYIYDKLVNNNTLDFELFIDLLSKNKVFSLLNISILIAFSLLNWGLESLKWKALVNTITPLSLGKAIEQSFGALTASLMTPNRIGEYGAKAIYYPKALRKKILALTLIGNLSQLLITTVIGSIGLLLFWSMFTVSINMYNLISALFLIGLIWYIMHAYGHKLMIITIKGFSLKALQNFINKLPTKVLWQTLSIAFIRYGVFSHQCYFLLVLFKVDVSYSTALIFISCMYIMASAIPTVFIFDSIIKGSIAVWLFSFVGANELIIIAITLLMWMLNFALPAMLGSYFVLNFNQYLIELPSDNHTNELEA